MNPEDRVSNCSASLPQRDSEPDSTNSLSAEGLRLLILSQVNSSTLCHGTGLRLSNFARHLAKSHEITLLCSENYPMPMASGRRVPSIFDFSRPYPFQQEFRDAVQRALASGRFDAAVVFGADLLQYAEGCKLPVIVDLVDEPVLATLRELPAQSGLERLRTIKHAISLIGYQRRLCRNVAACLVVSAENARAFSRVVPGVEVVVVTNGVDTAFFRPAGIPIEEGRIVFSGNMSFPPNVAACLYFAREVFPQVQAGFPGARWTIVGSDPHPSVQALGKLAGITVTGYVPELQPFIEQAAVVVSPLISGGGIKNKVLEAWAMKKAVVATSLGTAGVEARDGENVLIAGDARCFAEKTVFLLKNALAAETLGQAGYCTVIEKYAWEDKSDKLESLLRSAVARARRL